MRAVARYNIRGNENKNDRIKISRTSPKLFLARCAWSLKISGKVGRLESGIDIVRILAIERVYRGEQQGLAVTHVTRNR